MIDSEKIAHDLALVYVKHHLDEIRKMNRYYGDDLPVPKEVEELEIVWQTHAYAFQYLNETLSEDKLKEVWKAFDEGGQPKLF